MSAQRRRIISTSTQARTGKTRDSFRARRGHKAPKATPAISVPRDQRETPALRAQKGLKARQVPKESLDLRVTPGTPVLRDPREIPENQARPDPRGRKAQRVRMVR